MGEIFLFGIFGVLVLIWQELRKFVEMASKPPIPQVMMLEPRHGNPSNGNGVDQPDSIGFKG
jgi:hypothetical protein